MINGRLSSSSSTETSPTNHSNCIGSEQQLALHTVTHKPFTVQLHSGRCYTKIRGNGFRLLTQTKDIPCIIGGNREPRRATTDVHSLPIFLFYFFCIEKSMCSLLLFLIPFFSFLFFSSVLFLIFTSFPLLQFFSFSFLVYRPLRRLHFFIHAFWSQEIEEKLPIEGKLDLRLLGFVSCCTTIFGVPQSKACLLVPVELG